MVLLCKTLKTEHAKWIGERPEYSCNSTVQWIQAEAASASVSCDCYNLSINLCSTFQWQLTDWMSVGGGGVYNLSYCLCFSPSLTSFQPCLCVTLYHTGSMVLLPDNWKQSRKKSEETVPNRAPGCGNIAVYFDLTETKCDTRDAAESGLPAAGMGGISPIPAVLLSHVRPWKKQHGFPYKE